MGAITREPTPEQTTRGSTDMVTINSEPVPKKRGKRAIYTSLAICAITALLVLTFCIINREEDVYYLDKGERNTTHDFYTKKEKLTFPGLFTAALGLFSIVLGTLVDRLSLLVEECRHRRERYDGSWKKMIKACFSGIVWGSVLALLGCTLIIVILLIFFTDRPWFELNYLVYILSGIGVGPLVMQLLNLNTESKVYISTVLEGKEMCVANGLAWSYYFNYLEQALPYFEKIVNRPEHTNLSCKKLLLLVPHDCNMEELNKVDSQIEKLYKIGNDQDPFRFPVYRLTVNEQDNKQFAIQYVEAPLKALGDMSLLAGFNAVKPETCDEEVKLLYRTLSEILAHRKAQRVQKTCMLVPIKAINPESLQNGGLVKCIMDVVDRSCTQTDSIPSFVKVEKNKQFIVDCSRSKKATDGSFQSGRTRGKNHDAEKGKNVKFDKNAKDKQDDMNIDDTGKSGGKLKRKYKNNTTTTTTKKAEQKELIPVREDCSGTNNSTLRGMQRLIQETVDGNDSDATTSGINMEHISNRSHQSNQEEGDSLLNKEADTVL